MTIPGAMTFTPAGPGTIDINADSQLRLPHHLAPNRCEHDRHLPSRGQRPSCCTVEHNRHTLLALGEDLIAYDWFWGDSLVAADRIRYCSGGNGWYHVLKQFATGCTGASDSLLYCSPDASFGLSLGELPEVVGASFEFDVSDWEFVWTFNGESSDPLIGAINWPTDASGWYSAEAWDPFNCPW